MRKIGLPGGTRTPDLLLRRQLLYPVELRADGHAGGQGPAAHRQKAHEVGLLLRGGRSGGIRTRDPLLPKQMRYQAALRSDEAAIVLCEMTYPAARPSKLIQRAC